MVDRQGDGAPYSIEFFVGIVRGSLHHWSLEVVRLARQCSECVVCT